MIGTGSVGWAMIDGREYRVGGWGLPLSDEGRSIASKIQKQLGGRSIISLHVSAQNDAIEDVGQWV